MNKIWMDRAWKIFEFLRVKGPFLLLLIFGMSFSYAQETSEDLFNVMDTIEQMFASTSGGWLLNAEKYAKIMLLTLAVIDLICLGIKHVLKADSAQDVFNDVVWKVIFIGGILSILQFLPALTDPHTGVLKGFEILGAKITGISKLSPTGVIDTGLQVVSSLIQHIKQAPLTAIFEAGVYLIAIAVIIYCFIVIAVQIILTKIEAYLVMYGGCVFLFFAGSKFTKKYSSGYLTYILTVGVKLFIAYLIVAVGVGIGESVATKLAADPVANGDYQSVIITVVIFSIYATIAKSVSSIANGFFSGMSAVSSADHFATAGAAMATTAAIASGGKVAAPGSLNGLMGGIGAGLGKAAGGALFKSAGHAHAAANSMAVNMGHNMANGSPVETAAPKAAVQTLATAAKNLGSSMKDSVKGSVSDIYDSHISNVKSSPFSEQKMPPAPSSKRKP